MKRSVLFLALLVLALPAVTVLGFSIPIHRTVTTEMLETITAEVEGQPVTFSERALEQIADANESMDHGTNQALFHPEFHFTNEEFAVATTRLTNLKEQVVTNLTADPPDGDRARDLFGHALHAIQDFYSHSNWAELGNGGINDAFGEDTVTDPATTLQPCPTDPNMLGPGGGGGTTSAYYVGIFGCSTLPHPGKCYHGNYTMGCIGINKDLDAAAAMEHGVPVSPFHGQARSLAEAATVAFAELVLEEIEGNDRAIAAFLDVQGTTGFVIDDTGSMGGEIEGVKLLVTGIVNLLDALPFTRPQNWLLERFGDPDVGPPFITDDAEALLDAVNGLLAAGGGDCPELSMTALLEAIDSSFPSSLLFLFTDADAKDAPLINTVLSRASDKSTVIIPILTGSCGGAAEGTSQATKGIGPVDEAYSRIADETGGQLFFVDSSEVGMLLDLFEPRLTGDLVTVLSAFGDLERAVTTFDALVDSTMSSLVVSVSIVAKDSVVVRRPSGDPAVPADPDVTITELSGGVIVTIDDPDPGVWEVEVAGAGEFSVRAEGNSPIEFHRFDFVELNDDIHGGYFPIPGQPLAGSEAFGEATMLGPYASAEFELVDQGGVVLQTIDLVQNFPQASPGHFVGELALPTEPFRVVARGMDELGFEYRRQYPTVYRGQSVAVEVTGTGGSVPAGATSTVIFEVANIGSDAVFSIEVADTLGFVSGFDPGLLDLEEGATGSVEVDVTVPAETANGTAFTLTLTATNVEDPTVFNSAHADLVVQAIQPPMILDVFPTSGLVGTRVTITGSGFSAGGLEVFFDDVPGIDLQVVSDMTLLVTVPELPLGPQDVTVSTIGGMDFLIGGFTVLSPVDIPTVSSVGLVVLSLALLAVAFFVLRRNRNSALT